MLSEAKPEEGRSENKGRSPANFQPPPRTLFQLKGVGSGEGIRSIPSPPLFRRNNEQGNVVPNPLSPEGGEGVGPVRKGPLQREVFQKWETVDFTRGRNSVELIDCVSYA